MKMTWSRGRQEWRGTGDEGVTEAGCGTTQEKGKHHSEQNSSKGKASFRRGYGTQYDK